MALDFTKIKQFFFFFFFFFFWSNYNILTRNYIQNSEGTFRQFIQYIPRVNQ